MARKVFVSSDIAHDEKLLDVAACDPTAALLWPWLLTVFDDWGRALAEPRRLKAALFPGNDLVTVDVITRSLALLRDAALISVYVVDGKRYMAVDQDVWFKWQTHIRKEKREDDAGSKHPPPTEDAIEREDARENTPSPSPSPSASTATDGFTAFNARRAVEAVDQRRRSGLSVKSRSGLAKTIAKDPEHLAESKRIWAHRDCVACKGKGFTEEYAPGAGQRKVECGGV